MRGQDSAFPALEPVSPGGASHADFFKGDRWKSWPAGVLPGGIQHSDDDSARRPPSDVGDATSSRNFDRSFRDAKLLEKRRRSSGISLRRRSNENGASPNGSEQHKNSCALAPLITGDALSHKLLLTSMEAKLDLLLKANKRHTTLLEKAIQNITISKSSRNASPASPRNVRKQSTSTFNSEEHSQAVPTPTQVQTNTVNSLEEQLSSFSPSDSDDAERKQQNEAMEEKAAEDVERADILEQGKSPQRVDIPPRTCSKQSNQERADTKQSNQESSLSQWVSQGSTSSKNAADVVVSNGGASGETSPSSKKIQSSLIAGNNHANPYEHLGATRQRRPSVCSQKSNNSLTSFCSSTIARTVQFASKRNPILHHLWRLMEEPASVKFGTTYVILMDSTIILSVLFAFLQLTEESLGQSLFIRGIELAFDLFFTLETLLRFVACPNHLLFFADLYNIIDIVAGLPPLVLRTIVLTSSSQDFNDTADSILLCVVPVLRLLKFIRRFEKFHLLLKAFKLLIDALPVLLYTLAVILLAFSAFLYLVEPRSNIPTLGWSLYATLLTLTTVGYGDVCPESVLGQFLVCVLSTVSTLYLAIPLGIIGSAFSSVWEDRDRVLLLQRTRSQLREMGLGARDIPSLFRFFDKDMDGQLSLNEFRSMVSEMKLGISPRRIIELFRLMDKDDSGSIDDAEFMRTLFPVTHAAIYHFGKLDDVPYDSETSDLSRSAGC